MQKLIRPGRPEDIADLLRLIRLLAEYERAPEAVTNTEEALYQHAFGPQPCMGFFVAEVEGRVVGMAVYCTDYSTWKGKALKLEDLFVEPEYRGQGLGKALFDRVVQQARESGCVRINWYVLDWNQPAIDFYKTYPSTLDPTWILCSMYEPDLAALASADFV